MTLTRTTEIRKLPTRNWWSTCRIDSPALACELAEVSST